MDFIIRPYKQGEEKYVADLHKALYSTEYSWGPSFTDSYAMKIATDFAKGSKNDREELFVADCDGVLAGCIMLCQTAMILPLVSYDFLPSRRTIRAKSMALVQNADCRYLCKKTFKAFRKCQKIILNLDIGQNGCPPY